MKTNTPKVAHVTLIETPFVLGNRALRAGDYDAAINYYLIAQQATPAFDKIIAGNLAVARKKYETAQEISDHRSVMLSDVNLPEVSTTDGTIQNQFVAKSINHKINGSDPFIYVDLIQKKLNSGPISIYSDMNITAISAAYEKRSESSMQDFASKPASGCARMLLVAMIRNEGATLNQWLSHVLSLFDEIHIVDHGSTDGTRNILTALASVYSNLKLYFYDQPEYMQLQIMTHIAKNELTAKANDWAFFLDADEFLPFASKAEFVEKMCEYKTHSVIKLPWLNLIPEIYNTDGYVNKTYLKPYAPSSMSKISFKPAAFKEVEFYLEQGNHHLIVQGQRANAINAFNLLHIPVRSHDQISAKIRDGVSAYRAMNEHGTSIGFHWFEIANYLESNQIGQDDLNGIACTYSEKGRPIAPVSIAKLKEKGYTSYALTVSALTEESVLVNILESVYAEGNLLSNPSSNIKSLVIDLSKYVNIADVAHAKPAERQDKKTPDIASKICIIDKEYLVPHNSYAKAELDSAIRLCKKEILAFLGSRTISSDTYVIDYLDTPPLHTVFVADLLKTCKIIRLCSSSEEASFVRSLCSINSVDNVVVIEPDTAKTELFEKARRLTDQLVFPAQTASGKSDGFNEILLLACAKRGDVDSQFKHFLSHSTLLWSMFYVEDSQTQCTWRVSRPSNIYCFGAPNNFCRSEFAIGASTARKPGLDIAVAMYNTPNYIVDCVDSLISNGRDDINVIIVNDGSTDNSLEVVNKRYLGHPRVKIVTKKNGGCASARNYGRLHSTSTHITFVDSDDFTDPDLFANLYDLALYTGAEVTQSGFDFYHEDAEQQYTASYEDALFANYPRQEFRGHQIIHVSASDLICGQPTIWRRVYRRDFLDSKRIFFPENVRAYDDYIFHTLSIYYARDIFMIPNIKLHYRQHAAQDIKQGDERHFFEIYMFKQLLRRSLEEGWADFMIFLPSILNSIDWSLQILRHDLIKPFAHAAANFIWCVEKTYGSSITFNQNLATVKANDFHLELSRLRNANQHWHQSYVWAYIEGIDNHPITLSMLNAAK